MLTDNILRPVTGEKYRLLKVGHSDRYLPVSHRMLDQMQMWAGNGPLED